MPTDKRTLLLAIQTRLQDRNWTGSSNRVFGSGAVRVTKMINADKALKTMRVPLAIIIPDNFASDPQHGGQQLDYLVGNVTIRIATAHRGDEVGEFALVGGHRPSSTLSEGAGLLQIEQEVFVAVGQLNTEESVDLQFKDNGDSGGFIHPEFAYVGWQDLLMEAVCTRN